MTILWLFFDHNPMKILLIVSQVNSSFNSQLLFKEVTISRHPLIFLSDPNLQKLQTSNAEVPFTSTENPLFHHAEQSNPIIFFPPQNLQIARLSEKIIIYTSSFKLTLFQNASHLQSKFISCQTQMTVFLQLQLQSNHIEKKKSEFKKN